MAIQSWQNIIDQVRNGEPVTAEVANRAIAQLVNRTEHLKDRQDAQSLAQVIYLTGAPLTGCLTGNAVYFDPQLGKFAPAYADVDFKNGTLLPSASSGVVGIVIYKDTQDSGVIALEGWLDPDQYDDLDCQLVPMLGNLLLNSADRGVLYLCSGAANAGKVSSKPGLFNIPVCNLIGLNHLLVRPPLTSTLDTQALKFKLANKIATADLVLQSSSSTEFPPIGTTVDVGLAGISNNDITKYATGKVEQVVMAGGLPKLFLTDLKIDKAFIVKLAQASGSYAAALTPGSLTRILVKSSTVSYTFSGVGGASVYVAPAYKNPITGFMTLTENILDSTKAGWLPATSSVFNNSIIPSGAVYGYNVAADPVLQQLFPEEVVTAYLITKDGIGIDEQTVVINSSGIWWKDNLTQWPWHTVGDFSILPEVQVTLSDWLPSELPQLIMPEELNLVYAKLVTGGIKMVTSLESDDQSIIQVTDPAGNPASTGPLVIKAGIGLIESTNTLPGFVVVKELSGLSVKRGRVVERLFAGANVLLDSTAINGQGEVTVSIVGLDGKLEGQPDILAVDDILVERDPILNIFYSCFPPGKSSSILGKIDIPGYLVGSYRLVLVPTFIALHPAPSALQLPTLNVSFVQTNNPTTAFNLSACNTTEGAGSITPSPSATRVARDCVVAEYPGPTVIPKAVVFFKLSRSSDSYLSNLGLLSISYKFTKITTTP